MWRLPTMALAAALCLGAWAQKPLATPPPAAVPEATVSSRLLRMSAGNEALLQMAQIGEKRGATATVRRYAHRLALDHRKAEDLLQQKAEALGINLKSLGPVQNQPGTASTLQQLIAVSPAEFDHLFLTSMVTEDQQIIPLLNRGARPPAAGPLQSLMRQLAALIQIHLSLTQELLAPGAPV